MFNWGTQRILARVSCASATQTLACAAAIISGRASESRSAVARLIGNRRSVGTSGAALSVGMEDRGLADAENRSATGPPVEIDGPGRVGGSWARVRLIEGTTPGMRAAEGRPS